MSQPQNRERFPCLSLIIAPEGQDPKIMCRRTGISGENTSDPRMLEACPFNQQRSIPQVTDCTDVKVKFL